MTSTLPHPLHARRDPAAAAAPARGVERRRWEVRGTVQGVGFRPFVHRLATELALAGRVRNTGGTVLIDAEGRAEALDAFEARLRAQAPPLAAIAALVQLPARDGGLPAGFVIEESLALEATSDGEVAPAHRDVPPDAAICDACLAELFDPRNRRYRHPFINCVDCGPRATIIDDLPYDRRRTGMVGFELCEACAAEYRDPANRRFHAEPVACPECGPRLHWQQVAASPPTQQARGREVLGEDALRAAAACVAAGGIIALKGLGGFQFVCDATNEAAVALLRERKHRPSKPLAVMVADLRSAEAHARLSAIERQLLTGPARPIVLVEPRTPHGHRLIATGVRRESPALGLFLPTTPLHHLLVRALGRPLVVTSGNLGGEPIVIDDETARARLSTVADGICGHDRPILARYDDSVTTVTADRPAVVRRARGYAPAPLSLPIPARRPLLAVGAQLKYTFTLAQRATAITSAHIGDLEDAATHEAFVRCLHRLSRLHAIVPEYVVHDLHPGYLSTQYADRFPRGRRIAVQHHHAHIASCAAEHGLTEDVIGVAFDGLGLGDDGTLWGGEVMVANLQGYTRLGRFARAPLPGGPAAVLHPARMALGYLAGLERFGSGESGSGAFDREAASCFTDRLDQREVSTLLRMVARRINCPVASSAGRLFDAAAALLGLPAALPPGAQVSFEGEAAIALENAAGAVSAPALPWRLAHADGLCIYDPRPTLAALLDGVAAGTSIARLAAGFHEAIAEATTAMVEQAVRVVGAKPVCLSGGVWQNRRLAATVVSNLENAGLDVFVNQRVPCNDGGISYGQAAIAAARLSER
ncbi:carbamoyltransferase HypF [Actinocrinis sp.]|uniref:carbamoyltransferase HypF n=1 Tax=Actinocrinis sp. TaxID=1920516 RepID=UPI002D6D637C|nr:carbamoyltransferase HypF [Actinocrinis sp.]HZP53911.1 carbamoyltransferase HypF [Actinocrinis sp.]